MFHNFMRIARLPYVIRSSYYVTHGNKPLVISNISRFYCKDESGSKDDPSGKSKKEKVNICVTTRKNPYDICDPGKKRPCIPSPPPYNIGPRRCPAPSRMDSLPKPDCPWDPEYEKANKKYLKHLILGALFSAITLLVLLYNMNFTKPEKKEDIMRKLRRPKPTCKIPAKEEEIPDTVPYLLIGGGTASFSAFRAIKSSDPTAKVLVVSNECFFPYMRPPLSKEMWFNNGDKSVDGFTFKQWNGTERSLFYEPKDFYIKSKNLMTSANGGVSVIMGYKVNKIDVIDKVAYLESGRTIKYKKCLIATGGTPKNLSIFSRAKPELQNKVTLYRDIFDYQELNDICKEAKSLAIIGGGFLGSELACALGKIAQSKGTKVYQIFKEKGNMGKILPEYLSDWTTNKIRQEKVNIISNTEVEDAVLDDKGKVILHLNNGKKITADHVVVAIGIEPNTELAKTSDLEVDPDLNGFLVNAEMEARSHLYVAGDASCFYDVKLGRRRVEHHDHAVVSGRLAGENMTGAAKPYLHQSMFWSDLGPNIGYEAIGLVDSKLPTVAVFAKATDRDTPQAVVASTDNNLRSATEEAAEHLNQASIGGKMDDEDQPVSVKQLSTEKSPLPISRKSGKPDDYGKGVIFYLRNDVVVGIVLWNVFNRMSIARQVLKEDRKYEDLNEVAKLFNIHEG